MAFDWQHHTVPFLDEAGAEPARFGFAQVGDDSFALHEGFLYAPDGAGAASTIEVSSSSLVTTDLASIPWFMAWFVPVNGRHTPAALVHDQLVDQSKPYVEHPGARAAADDVFLAAMSAIDVPVLRRHIMHTAVTAATRWTSGAWARLGMALWGLAAVAGTVALVVAVVTQNPMLGILALVAPAAGAVLWSPRRYRQGLLAGYAVWVIGGPALACIAAYGIYWLAEQGVRVRSWPGGPTPHGPRCHRPPRSAERSRDSNRRSSAACTVVRGMAAALISGWTQW